MKSHRKPLLYLFCLLCIVGGIFLFPFPFSVANKEVASITAGIIHYGYPEEITEQAAIAEFVDAFSHLSAHFNPGVFIPRGGAGHDITFNYADGTKDTYEFSPPFIVKNGKGIPLELSDEVCQNIDDALFIWYYHGLDFQDWREIRSSEAKRDPL